MTNLSSTAHITVPTEIAQPEPLQLREKLSGYTLGEVAERLREVDALCGDANKNDRASTLIAACIDYGIDRGADIVEMLGLLGFDPKHVRTILVKSRGGNPELHLWHQDSVSGIYSNFGQDDELRR